MLFSLLTFISWGVADLFYKKGNITKEKYNDVKTGIVVGFVMGLHALVYMIINHLSLDFVQMLKYLPVSICYISSMVIGYKGLKYIELSIMSPVQNTSGVITSILLLLVFREVLLWPAYIAFALIFFSIFYICMLEKKEDNIDRKFDVSISGKRKYKILAILLAIGYCIIDGIGTFLDGIYLDKLELISEDQALLCYEFTFLIFGLIALMWIHKKGESLRISKQKDKILAAGWETLGQFFYVFAMAHNSTIGASIVGSYCVLSMILSRIFLKEKLPSKKLFAIITAIIGIVILLILDV